MEGDGIVAFGWSVPGPPWRTLPLHDPDSIEAVKLASHTSSSSVTGPALMAFLAGPASLSYFQPTPAWKVVK